jgi:hypothetical protein
VILGGALIGVVVQVAGSAQEGFAVAIEVTTKGRSALSTIAIDVCEGSTKPKPRHRRLIVPIHCNQQRSRLRLLSREAEGNFPVTSGGKFDLPEIIPASFDNQMLPSTERNLHYESITLNERAFAFTGIGKNEANLMGCSFGCTGAFEYCQIWLSYLELRTMRGYGAALPCAASRVSGGRPTIGSRCLAMCGGRLLQQMLGASIMMMASRVTK